MDYFMDKKKGSETSRRIAAALKDIPPGEVSTYGDVAHAAGLANGARQVVRLLHSSAEREDLPWHRIVRKDGSIALPEGGGFELQKALLTSEGVEVDTSGRVDLGQFGHRFLSGSASGRV